MVDHETNLNSTTWAFARSSVDLSELVDLGTTASLHRGRGGVVAPQSSGDLRPGGRMRGQLCNLVDRVYQR